MALSAPEARPVRNRLLAALPPAEDAQLCPYLERVTLGVKEVIYEPYQPIPYIYFPETGVTSILVIMRDGKASEVGLVGSEGMLGLPVFLGAETSPGRSFSQVPGESLRMAAEVFAEVLPRRARSCSGCTGTPRPCSPRSHSRRPVTTCTPWPSAAAAGC